MEDFSKKAGNISGDQFILAIGAKDRKTAAQYLASDGDPNYEDKMGRRAVHVIGEHACDDRLDILRQSLRDSALLKVNWLGYDGDTPPSKDYKLPSQRAFKQGERGFTVRMFLEELEINYAYQNKLPYKGVTHQKRYFYDDGDQKYKPMGLEHF